jgi:hypothetical protein
VNNCVTGVLRVDDTHVLLLSAGRILLEQERALLAELRNTEQTRVRALQTP